MNLENLLKFFVLSVRQYQMGAGYVKANLKFVKIFFLNVMTFVWSVRFRTQIVRNRTGLNEGKNR